MCGMGMSPRRRRRGSSLACPDPRDAQVPSAELGRRCGPGSFPRNPRRGSRRRLRSRVPRTARGPRVRERARPGRRPRPEPLPSRPIGRTGRARGPRGRRRAPPGAAPAPTSCSRGRGSPDAPRCPARAHPAPSRVSELRPPLGSRVAAGVSTITPRRPRNLVAPEAAAARPLPRSDSGRLQGPAARRAFFLGNFSLVCGAG